MSYFCRAKRSFKPYPNELDVVKQTREIMFVTSSGKFQSCYMIPREGTQPIFGYRQTVEGLKHGPCLGQKNPKIHILLRTTPSILLPWLEPRTKFQKIRFKVNAFLYLKHKQISYSKSNQSYRQYPVSIRTDSHEIRQRRQKPYPAQPNIPWRPYKGVYPAGIT